ncbi:MAG: nucleotidyltransferase family protein [Hyphomicrobiaceae bacterium]
MSNSPSRSSAVAAVLLAAGASRRFGSGNKLLARIDGEPLIRRVAARLIACALDDIVVVTGPEPDKIAAALEGLPVRYVHNSEHARGMGRSIATGIAALDADALGALVCLGDMPGVTVSSIRLSIARFEQTGRSRIVYPCDHAGRQGHPVLWPRTLFTDLSRLDGDRGGKSLIADRPDRSEPVAVDDPGIFMDVDTQEDLAAGRRKGA